MSTFSKMLMAKAVSDKVDLSKVVYKVQCELPGEEDALGKPDGSGFSPILCFISSLRFDY